MIRVIDQASVLIQKNSLCFLEGHAVLRRVGSSFAAIPGKRNIAHSIILAILGHTVREASVRSKRRAAGISEGTRGPLIIGAPFGVAVMWSKACWSPCAQTADAFTPGTSG